MTTVSFWILISIAFFAICFLCYILFGGSLSGEFSFGGSHIYENFNQVPPSFKAGFTLAIITILSSLLVFFFYFKRFMKLVYEGKYFDLKTIRNLRLISYLLAVGFILGFIFSTNVGSLEKVTQDGSSLQFTFHSPSFYILFTALVFWVLSHIFTEGARLKEDNELTI
jgi:hypothetical protein